MATVTTFPEKVREFAIGEKLFWVGYLVAPLIIWWTLMDHFWSVGSLAACINHISGTYYNREMYHRRIKPDGVAWAILAFAGVLFTGNHFLLKGADSGAMFIMSTLDMIATAIIAMWRHHEPIVRNYLDRTLFAVSLISGFLCFSLFFPGSTPNAFLVVLVINCGVDLIGMRLLIKNAWVPGRENWRPWALTALACTINVFAVQVWSSSEMILPLYFCMVNVAMFLVVFLVSCRRWVGDHVPGVHHHRPIE